MGAGCPLDVGGNGATASIGYANCFDPLGVRIEYDDVAPRPLLGAFLASGDHSTAVPRVEEAHFNIIVA